MLITIRTEQVKDFMGVTGCKSPVVLAKMERGWRGDVDIPLDSLSASDFELFYGWLKQNNKGAMAGTYRKVDVYRKLRAKPTGTPIPSLQALVTALKMYIAPSEHRWVFTERDDGLMIPYYVESIQYFPSKREDPAYTEMKLSAWCRGENIGCRVHWSFRDIGKTKGDVVSLLQEKRYFLETPEAVERYKEELVHHQEIQGKTGEQFLATGTAQRSGWYGGAVSMERDGRATKVVMDDEGDDDDGDRRRRNEQSGVSSSTFWTNAGDGDASCRDDSADAVVALPVHPYVRVFDLEKHAYASIHTSNLSAYEYDDSLFEKLVLPEDTKDMINILVNSSRDQLDDIVKGKTGGTIIIATGPPGTGKTLTAEVFSETINRPLYVVQCSQLGTDEEELEKQLVKVLNRATRWNAILLIDEADVYVHERGKDIKQNAIVGVFLRVLEYYRGILFMTSNRSTIIDDAIMSRATAWVQYAFPTTDERVKIWEILSKQFNIELSEETLSCLRTQTKLGNITGRNIKNLLKLAKRLAVSNGGEVTYDLLIRASKFLGINPKVK